MRRELTGREIEDVIKTVLRRASSPRPGSHPDELAQRVVAVHGRAAVVECARLILAGDCSRRAAGAVAFGSDNYLDGLDVGSAVSIYLHRGEV